MGLLVIDYKNMSLLAIIFSFNRLLIKKKGAIRGPVAPIKIELIPLMPPTQINELSFFSFFGFLKNKYQIINIPMSGFNISTFISFAELT